MNCFLYLHHFHGECELQWDKTDVAELIKVFNKLSGFIIDQRANCA